MDKQRTKKELIKWAVNVMSGFLSFFLSYFNFVFKILGFDKKSLSYTHLRCIRKWKNFWKILVANCQKQNVTSLVWRLAILKPYNIICYSCHHIASAVITMTVASENFHSEETWSYNSSGNFTELLTFRHSNSPGSNWLLLIRVPCCNWQLWIRCCQLLR